MKASSPVPALLVAIGLVVSAFLLADAVRDFRISDRTVEVRGFAEREVPADLAIWPINYMLSANDLDALRQTIERKDAVIMEFLAERGFEASEISRNPPRINDQWMYASPEHRPAERFTAERGLTLRTTNVVAARAALQEAVELVARDVLLAPGWGQSAQFLFTGLEDIKPEMIAEATADARRAAAQFAADSEAKVGAIRSARQGVFSIGERDPSMPEVKLVRVVTTIEYILD